MLGTCGTARRADGRHGRRQPGRAGRPPISRPGSHFPHAPLDREPGAVRHRRDPGTPLRQARGVVARVSLFGLSLVFRQIVQARLWLYRKRFLRNHPLGCMVISVGNLTVGGTGKTPVVERLARTLHARRPQGRHPQPRLQEPPPAAAQAHPRPSHRAHQRGHPARRQQRAERPARFARVRRRAVHARHQPARRRRARGQGPRESRAVRRRAFRRGHAHPRRRPAISPPPAPARPRADRPAGALRQRIPPAARHPARTAAATCAAPATSSSPRARARTTPPSSSASAATTARPRSSNAPTGPGICRRFHTAASAAGTAAAGRYVGAFSAIAAPESRSRRRCASLARDVELSRRFTDHHRFNEQEIRTFAARCAAGAVWT